MPLQNYSWFVAYYGPWNDLIAALYQSGAILSLTFNIQHLIFCENSTDSSPYQPKKWFDSDR